MASRRNCSCVDKKEESMSDRTINRIKNVNKMERKGSMVLCPREGDHGCATDADEEEDLIWLAQAKRGGSGRLNQFA